MANYHRKCTPNYIDDMSATLADAEWLYGFTKDQVGIIHKLGGAGNCSISIYIGEKLNNTEWRKNIFVQKHMD